MVTVAALYRFTSFPDPASIRARLLPEAEAAGICGTLLIAPEGINGTIAGSREGIDRALAAIKSLPGCENIEWKESQAEDRPFNRLRVRLKREIVTMGQPDVDPAAGTGTYVDPVDWNAVISDVDTVVIDTRNDYEVAIGTFAGALDPGTRSFGEFPAWWEANRDRFQGKRVAMFCTGGIRCEKSTNYLLGQGVNDVLHLKGGILKYLEEVPERESLWRGACFVFDGRVSVTHGLEEGPHVLCHACRRPLLPEDRARPEFEEGVACHHCASETSDATKARFRERQRQIAFARARGTRHLGISVAETP